MWKSGSVTVRSGRSWAKTSAVHLSGSDQVRRQRSSSRAMIASSEPMANGPAGTRTRARAAHGAAARSSGARRIGRMLTSGMPGGPIDVFILGSVFSGSTVVGNALGIHPEAFFAGEVAALPAYSEAYQVMHAIDGCLGCAAL